MIWGLSKKNSYNFILVYLAGLNGRPYWHLINVENYYLSKDNDMGYVSARWFLPISCQNHLDLAASIFWSALMGNGKCSVFLFWAKKVQKYWPLNSKKWPIFGIFLNQNRTLWKTEFCLCYISKITSEKWEFSQSLYQIKIVNWHFWQLLWNYKVWKIRKFGEFFTVCLGYFYLPSVGW